MQLLIHLLHLHSFLSVLAYLSLCPDISPKSFLSEGLLGALLWSRGHKIRITIRHVIQLSYNKLYDRLNCRFSDKEMTSWTPRHIPPLNHWIKHHVQPFTLGNIFSKMHWLLSVCWQPTLKQGLCKFTEKETHTCAESIIKVLKTPWTEIRPQAGYNFTGLCDWIVVWCADRPPHCLDFISVSERTWVQSGWSWNGRKAWWQWTYLHRMLYI